MARQMAELLPMVREAVNIGSECPPMGMAGLAARRLLQRLPSVSSPNWHHAAQFAVTIDSCMLERAADVKRDQSIEQVGQVDVRGAETIEPYDRAGMPRFYTQDSGFVSNMNPRPKLHRVRHWWPKRPTTPAC